MKIFEMNNVKFRCVNSQMCDDFIEDLVIGNKEYGTSLILDKDDDENFLYVQHIDGSAKSIRIKVI